MSRLSPHSGSPRHLRTPPQSSPCTPALTTNHSNSKIISKDLDEDSLASLCLLLHPLHRLVGGDVHTKFLEMVKMAMISCQHKILDGDDNMQTIIIINSPCCGDRHSPLPLLMAIHTWLGRCCCLSLTMMVAGSVMSMMTTNNGIYMITFD